MRLLKIPAILTPGPTPAPRYIPDVNLVTTDPICGMTVSPDSPRRVEHEGTTYLFCSDGCRTKFLQTPIASLSVAASPNIDPKSGWRAYLPLLVIILLTALAAEARQLGSPDPAAGGFMQDFMGFFLVVFSMFKLFDLPGFADGFQMYDLFAKPFRPYAFLYPFLELALGLGYLARWQPRTVYLATIVLMSFGALGVFRSLLRRQQIQCACLGTILQVPLSTVAAVENLGMAAMALAMLLPH